MVRTRRRIATLPRSWMRTITGKPMNYCYVDQPRVGDHICYISDLTKARAHYPGWRVSRSLDDIFVEIAEAFTPGRAPA